MVLDYAIWKQCKAVYSLHDQHAQRIKFSCFFQFLSLIYFYFFHLLRCDVLVLLKPPQTQHGAKQIYTIYYELY